jgi:hypothetical protein
MRKRKTKIEKLFSKYSGDKSDTWVKSVELDNLKSMGRIRIHASSDENLNEFIDNYERDENFSKNVVVLDNPTRVVGYDKSDAEFSFGYSPENLDKTYNEKFPSYLSSKIQKVDTRGSRGGINYKKNICLFLIILLIVILAFFGFYSIVFVT